MRPAGAGWRAGGWRWSTASRTTWPRACWNGATTCRWPQTPPLSAGARSSAGWIPASWWGPRSRAPTGTWRRGRVKRVRLEGPRVVLREFELSDFEAVHAYGSDPEVVRFMVWGPNEPPDT